MNIPNGFKLVPVEPTEEMISGFWGEITHGDEEREAAKLAYSDMLAAAPTPSQPIYDEEKERELFEVSHPVPECVEWDDEFNRYLVNLYPGEFDSEYGSLWDGWKACAKSRARSAE